MLRPCWKMMVQSPFWGRMVHVSPRELQHKPGEVRTPIQEMVHTSTKLWRVLSTSLSRFLWMARCLNPCPCRNQKARVKVKRNPCRLLQLKVNQEVSRYRLLLLSAHQAQIRHRKASRYPRVRPHPILLPAAHQIPVAHQTPLRVVPLLPMSGLHPARLSGVARLLNPAIFRVLRSLPWPGLRPARLRAAAPLTYLLLPRLLHPPRVLRLPAVHLLGEVHLPAAVETPVRAPILPVLPVIARIS